MSGFTLSADAFCFEPATLPPVGVPSREALRQAIYAGGTFASTGQLALDGYDDLNAVASARLDAMVDGALQWLARNADA